MKAKALHVDHQLWVVIARLWDLPDDCTHSTSWGNAARGAEEQARWLASQRDMMLNIAARGLNEHTGPNSPGRHCTQESSVCVVSFDEWVRCGGSIPGVGPSPDPSWPVDFPHECPTCGGPAYIGFNRVECQGGGHP